MRSMRPGRSKAASSDSGMFVAMIVRMRYFGGFLGGMQRKPRTTRLKKPRGLLRPDISVRIACSVPMPPPPPMPMPAMKGSLRRLGLTSLVEVSKAAIASSCKTCWAPDER